MGVVIAYHAFHGILRYESAIIEREIKYFAQSSFGLYAIWACSHLDLYACMKFSSYYSGGMFTTHTSNSNVSMANQFLFMFPNQC